MGPNDCAAPEAARAQIAPRTIIASATSDHRIFMATFGLPYRFPGIGVFIIARLTKSAAINRRGRALGMAPHGYAEHLACVRLAADWDTSGLAS
jgi:hypothetical protein